MKTGSATLQVNDMEVSWTEDSRRKLQPCTTCGKLTRGRGKVGSAGLPFAAHIACALRAGIDKMLKISKPKPAARKSAKGGK